MITRKEYFSLLKLFGYGLICAIPLVVGLNLLINKYVNLVIMVVLDVLIFIISFAVAFAIRDGYRKKTAKKREAFLLSQKRLERKHKTEEEK